VVTLTSVSSLVLSILLLLFSEGDTSYNVGGWSPPYGIVLRADMLTLIMLVITSIVFTSASLYEWGRESAEPERTAKMTYHLTFPMLLLGLNGLFLTADFFNFYVFFELVAVSSYLLVAMGRHHSLEAAWKYAAISVPSSVALLSGVAFIYGITGSLNMADVSTRLEEPALWLAPLILVAFFIKSSIFPFHLWQPDAYAAASTAGSVVLSGALANVGIYGLLRFWPLLFQDRLRWIFLWIGMGSVIFGAVAAWIEKDAKRLLAFSSISQLGFVLVGIGWGTIPSLAASIVFLAHHSLGKPLLFQCAGLLTDSVGSTRLGAVGGLGARIPWVGAAFFLGSLSLIGLPPALGFIGKLSILHAGIGLRSWPWVLGVAAGTLMTLGYAVRAYQALFWQVDAPRSASQAPVARAPWPAYLAIGVLAFTLLAAGLSARPVWELSRKAAVFTRLIVQAAPGKGAP